MDLSGKHLLTGQDWADDELGTLLGCAADLKAKMKRGIPHKYLDSKSLMIFPAVGSPVMRSAFETGIFQLGGNASTICRLSVEQHFPMDPPVMVRRVGRHAHGMAIASYRDELPGATGGAHAGAWDIRELAQNASVPVYNMMSRLYDPVQAIADLMTVRERFGNDLGGLRFVCCWAHTKAPSWRAPTAQSLVLTMSRFGMNVVLSHPPEFGLDGTIIELAKRNSAASGGTFETVDSMDEAFEKAAVVYPISWPCIADGVGPDEKLRLAEQYPGWICDGKKLELLATDGIYMHCLPARRGSEVTDGVIDGPRSVVLDQAENVLHTAKALMTLTM